MAQKIIEHILDSIDRARAWADRTDHHFAMLFGMALVCYLPVFVLFSLGIILWQLNT